VSCAKFWICLCYGVEMSNRRSVDQVQRQLTKVPHHTTPRHATPRHATPRHATPRHATPRHATPRHVTPRHVTSRQATPRHATARHATPRHATSRHVTSRLSVPQVSPVENQRTRMLFGWLARSLMTLIRSRFLSGPHRAPATLGYSDTPVSEPSHILAKSAAEE
jgi:hypothetical protein